MSVATSESPLVSYPPFNSEILDLAAVALTLHFGILEPGAYLQYASFDDRYPALDMASDLADAGRLDGTFKDYVKDLLTGPYANSVVVLKIPDVITTNCAVSPDVIFIPTAPDILPGPDAVGILLADDCDDEEDPVCPNEGINCAGRHPGEGYLCGTCSCVPSCFGSITECLECN